MRKRPNWTRIAFWSLCAWCSWVLAVRGQEPMESRISFETVEWSPPKAISLAGPTMPASEARRATSPKILMPLHVVSNVEPHSVGAANCDPKTRQPLEHVSPEGMNLQRLADMRNLERCVQILSASRIDADRLRALTMLERMPYWAMAPGAIPAVRGVLLMDYNVQMRAVALRMLTSIDLPMQTIAPILATTARFDGSPELRQVAKAMLTPPAMTLEQPRTMMAGGPAGNIK